ncbi:uncharacterized protein LOC121056952 [Cygnus olor]|uniref:uncharacterized protein LOC121056952 n=1 Tax=Cygnus olor TaxID=8869 RepID=UPI001ADE7555|nr:uncharacterized protein LOC121056952 [Cygnus olor]
MPRGGVVQPLELEKGENLAVCVVPPRGGPWWARCAGGHRSLSPGARANFAPKRSGTRPQGDHGWIGGGEVFTLCFLTARLAEWAATSLTPCHVPPWPPSAALTSTPRVCCLWRLSLTFWGKRSRKVKGQKQLCLFFWLSVGFEETRRGSESSGVQGRVQVSSPGNTWKIFLPRFLSKMQQGPPCSLSSLHPTLRGYLALVLCLNPSSSPSSLYTRPPGHLLLGPAAP